MVVTVCRLSIFASHCHSLKEKRSVLRTVKDRVWNRFRVTLAEVGGMDTWQRAVLGFAVVGSERAKVEGKARAVVGFIEDLGVCEVGADEHETLVYGEGHMGGAWLDDREDDSWVPEAWKEDES